MLAMPVLTRRGDPERAERSAGAMAASNFFTSPNSALTPPPAVVVSGVMPKEQASGCSCRRREP
jgi:hypothetical protein